MPADCTSEAVLADQFDVIDVSPLHIAKIQAKAVNSRKAIMPARCPMDCITIAIGMAMCTPLRESGNFAASQSAPTNLLGVLFPWRCLLLQCSD